MKYSTYLCQQSSTCHCHAMLEDCPGPTSRRPTSVCCMVGHANGGPTPYVRPLATLRHYGLWEARHPLRLRRGCRPLSLLLQKVCRPFRGHHPSAPKRPAPRDLSLCAQETRVISLCPQETRRPSVLERGASLRAQGTRAVPPLTRGARHASILGRHAPSLRP